MHLPYNTTITSAVDGNNNPVSNGGSTSSTSITFTVQAPAGSNPVAGFQCSLDNSPFSSCGIATNNAGTITFNILVKGSHTVKIVAVDSQGNVDSTPATFSRFITQQQIPPVANAGSDQEVQSSQIVHLDGSASSDPSGFTPLAYQWTQTSGPSMSLSNSNSATPSFTAPHVSDETDLTFQ